MKFGTSGLRGLATDLIGLTSSLHAEAFLIHLRGIGMAEKGAAVFIGSDFRKSSPVIRSSCASGVLAQGMFPVSCGELPTPALANYAMGQGAPCMMITGSHIPEDRNGIKFYRPDGEIGKSDEAAINRIANQIRDGYRVTGIGDTKVGSDNGAAMSAFVGRCKNIVPANSLSGLKIGVFEHSSVARDMLHDVLNYMGVKTVELGRSATFVAVDTAAVSDETEARLEG